jgi:hypothetical protein
VLQCIGFLRRKTVEDGVSYFWREYLLFNPYKGFRWLMEQNGHWLLLKNARGLPVPGGSAAPGQPIYKFHERTYTHFQSCRAEVVAVVGEFYWSVRVGETADCGDYVCPPFALSLEKTNDEMVWSEGEYLTGAQVWAAFQLSGSPPIATGVAPAQPAPGGLDPGKLWTITAAIAFLAILIHIGVVHFSRDEEIFKTSLVYDSTELEKAKVTPSFTIPGHTSNLIIRTYSPLNNHWLYNSYALINEETGLAYDFGQEVSLYQGYEDGEHWTDGNAADEACLAGVPPGRYYLRVEPQSDMPRAEYEIRVRRDVVATWPLFLVLFLLPIPACNVALRSRLFEVARWKESDHPIVTSSED